MDSLIQITKNTINGAEVNSVNAREIHEYLEVKTVFPNWIKRAIEKYDFIENEDYISILTDSKSGKRDFIVTLDMAKELAMLENNPKGKETRKYFIKFEKKAKDLINNQSQEIQLLQGMLNTISKMDNRVVTIESEVDYLKNESPIVYNQIKILEDKRKSRTRELVGYNPSCEKSKANYSRTIRALTKSFKNKFGVSRYADLPKFKYNEALKWVSNVELVDLI